MTLGDKVGDPVAVTERTESIDVEIAGNYTENERNIVVEMADAGAEPNGRRSSKPGRRPRSY